MRIEITRDDVGVALAFSGLVALSATLISGTAIFFNNLMQSVSAGAIVGNAIVFIALGFCSFVSTAFLAILTAVACD